MTTPPESESLPVPQGSPERGTAESTREGTFTSAQKLGLLSTLYLSQGLPQGFFSSLPALLREQGMTLANIGLTNLLALPWILKFLWAPWVDRKGWGRLGHQRGWILLLQGIIVLLLVAMSTLDLATALGLVMVVFFAINLMAATQDVATDGLAVRILSHKERGLGNGIQVAGYRLGMVLGGGVLLIFYHRLGWQWSFLIMAATLVLAALPIAFHREAPREAGEQVLPYLATFREFFSRPGMLPWLLVLFLYKGGDAVASGMLKPFLVDLGLSLGEIGAMTGVAGVVAGLLGALTGGAAVSLLGRRATVVGFGILQAFVVAAYMLPATGVGGRGLLTACVVADYFAGGLATAAIFTLMMDICRRATAGTDYTIQASLVMLSPILARSVSGYGAQSFGFAGNYALSASLSLAGALAAAGLLANRRFRERLLAGTGARW